MCPIIQCGMCDKLIPPAVLKIEPNATFCSKYCTEDHLSMTECSGPTDDELVSLYGDASYGTE